MAPKAAILNLKLTKSGRRVGAFEAVTVSDQGVLAALQTLLQIRESQRMPGLLWQHSPQMFRSAFRNLCKTFHVDSLSFSAVLAAQRRRNLPAATWRFT